MFGYERGPSVELKIITLQLPQIPRVELKSIPQKVCQHMSQRKVISQAGIYSQTRYQESRAFPKKKIYPESRLEQIIFDPIRHRQNRPRHSRHRRQNRRRHHHPQLSRLHHFAQ